MNLFSLNKHSFFTRQQFKSFRTSSILSVYQFSVADFHFVKPGLIKYEMGIIVQLLSTKIVQISDTSMKLSQITKVPKGNIF